MILSRLLHLPLHLSPLAPPVPLARSDRLARQHHILLPIAQPQLLPCNPFLQQIDENYFEPFNLGKKEQ